jgi:amidase
VQDAIEEMLPYLEPSFVGPTTPADAWPTLTRLIPDFTLPPGYATFMDYIVAAFFDHSLFPHQIGERSPNLVINLRRLSSGAPPGELGQGKYAFNRYLIKRGDTNITSVADLNDVITPCTQAAFETGFCGKARALFVGKNPPSNTATRLDLPGDASHLFRQQALREIVLHVMAANKLDALIYPHHTVPSALLFQPSTVNVESRPAGGWNALTDVSGLPDMVVPGGFTSEAYDVAPCTEPGALTDPAAPADTCLLRREVTLPFAISFLGRPFDEAGLFEVASGYESVSMHRRPPADFGPLPGEP